MSLGSSLLRLMMTGLIFLIIEPTTFILSFLVSEFVSLFFPNIKEVYKMVIRVLQEFKLFFNKPYINRLVDFTFSYEFNSLMIRCNSDEKRK